MPDDQPTAAPRRTILFVCTGNTCRSPLAEALCRAALAEALGVPASDLHGRGYEVLSAGVAAMPGDAATPDAVAIAAEYGADLAGHRSRPVNPEMLAAATDVIAMTAAHAVVLEYRFPGCGPVPQLLAGDADFPDPFGGDAAVYRACAAAVRRHLDRWLKEWLGS